MSEVRHVPMKGRYTAVKFIDDLVEDSLYMRWEEFPGINSIRIGIDIVAFKEHLDNAIAAIQLEQPSARDFTVSISEDDQGSLTVYYVRKANSEEHAALRAARKAVEVRNQKAEARERAELARLQAKYSDVNTEGTKTGRTSSSKPSKSNTPKRSRQHGPI